jgi:hypothetical protein
MPPPGRKGFDEFVAEDRKLWAPAVQALGGEAGLALASDASPTKQRAPEGAL